MSSNENSTCIKFNYNEITMQALTYITERYGYQVLVSLSGPQENSPNFHT